MGEIEKIILSDKNLVPDDKMLSLHLKDKMSLWLKLLKGNVNEDYE